MFVSILQLMGFPMGKPVHSRAGEVTPELPQQAHGGHPARTEDSQMSSARRQAVKAKSGKNIKTPPPSAKTAAKAKPVAKPAVKPVANSPAKLPAKPPAKSVTKSAPKTVAAASKPALKSVPKPVTKPPVKAKLVAKPAAKAKVVAKPVKSKPAPKVVAALAAKPAVAPKAPAKSASTKTPAVPASKPAAKPAPTEKVPAPMIPIANKPVPAAAAAPMPAAVPQKTGRPSSRLAQLTVPSMAQSVASTAAKASYSQAVVAPLIVPAMPSSIKKDPKLANNWKTKPAAELTDAELMAMPDAEYMNEAQLASFRHKLVVLKRDILNSAGETTEHLREDSSVVPDPADRATIEEEHALELRTRDRERKLLKKIEQSIGRIDAGDYGYCDETGEPIGVGRLLARPTATLSLEAQQRRELKQKMFGD